MPKDIMLEVSDIAAPAQDKARGKSAEVNETLSIDMAPTLANYRTRLARHQEMGHAVQYAKGATTTDALDPELLVKSQFANLGSKTPEQQADFGATVGSAIGLSQGSRERAIIGATVGSVVGRAVGRLQDGEYKRRQVDKAALEGLRTLRVVGDDGALEFPDGGSFALTFDSTAELPNSSPVLSGKATRYAHELDKTHPFTSRAVQVAGPLAYYISDKLGGATDNEHAKRTAGLLTNALIKDAKSVDQVYTRAKHVAKKLGLSEAQMRSYFSDIRDRFNEDDGKQLKLGLDKIYAA